MLTMPNASADFTVRVEVESEDAYGDSVTNTEWQAVDRAQDVDVRFEARGTEFVTEGGERVSRPSKLFAPLEVDDEPVGEGDRVTVRFRASERTYRIISYDPRTIEPGQGYLDLDLEDWSDSDG